MSGALVAADMQRSFSLSADWLEILALARPQQYATDGDIATANDILEDRAAVAAEDDLALPEEDPDILDPATERALDAVFEEVSHRQRVLGAAYPFDLKIGKRTLSLSVSPEADDPIVEQARAIYIACLYMTGVRGGLIDAKAAKIRADPDMGNAFQICATIAAAGYMSGDAYWFGHPRPDETPFMDAIRKVAGLLQGTAAPAPPPGETLYAKDRGIDVIAWRAHHDGRPAKLIMYGQCASGMDWVGKPVTGKVHRMDSYYTLAPSKNWIPALLTPFPLYSEKENGHRLRTEEAMQGFYRQNEAEMGVIIDRLRIVRWCIEALRDVQPSMKEAVDKLDDLFAWSRTASEAVRLAA
ncbi:hypothetical protein [Novosphingobium sp. JCM 18896]|uniref:hypothetical protein n=1 Tax=Novosphingobium sp. JCM 18896 TaxID=2989731 RepID=UPI0022224FA7|nr:hypothetical protein [Novosphingobium sp. JCM 18896]MCW1432077.1 hypothetical protein [Novosphingobium sp. JCM 18896]